MMKRFLFALSVLWVTLPFSSSFASLQISGIKVDIQADSGLKARELAIADARRKAFVELTQNNSAFYYDLKTNGMPSDDVLEAAVDTFEIEEEKVSAKRYVGTLSITFNDEALRRLLSGDSALDDEFAQDTQNQRAEPKETSYKDVVLLPLYFTADEALLWQPGNPWKAYWEAAPHDASFKALIPLGDLQDIMGTSIEDIMTGQYQKVQKLLSRYQKDALVVAVLKRVSPAEPHLELIIKLFEKERLVFSSEPLFLDGSTLAENFKQARVEIIKLLQNQSAAPSYIKSTSLQTYPITASFSSFAQWQHIRRGLKTAAIESFSVSNLSRSFAKIEVKSNLSFNILASELARNGLILSESTPGKYELQIARNPNEAHPLPSYPEKNLDAPNDLPKIKSAFD